ncbi:hypothetical protein QQ045_028358 [Rhodiola kirilowii]
MRMGVARPRLQPCLSDVDIPCKQYGVVDDKTCISFTITEFVAGAALFQFSLIGKFTLGRPLIGEIRKIPKDSWDIKGRATINDTWDNLHVTVILDSEADVTTTLTSLIQSLDSNPKKEATITTKWFRLPGLPPPPFSMNFVGAIVNSFASFLDLGERSKECSTSKFARSFEEVDMTKEIPNELKTSVPNGRSYWQSIEVDGNIHYCSHCKIHGHALANWRKTKTS